MLFEGLDRIKRSTIMTTIVMIVAGCIMLVLPSEIIPYLSALGGFVFLVAALVSVFDFLSSKRALIHYIYLTIGLLVGMLGVFFLIFENFFVNMLTWLVCLFPVAGGLYGIYHALTFARRSGRRGWWILLILSTVLIVFGGFAFYNPWYDTTESTMRIIGATLMYTSVVNILQLIWLWPVRKENGGQ